MSNTEVLPGTWIGMSENLEGGRVLNSHHAPNLYHAIYGVAQLLKKRIAFTNSTSFYCFISFHYREPCVLAKECLFSPISNGELLRVAEQRGWSHSDLCFKKIILASSRKKEDGKGQERSQGDQLGSYYCFLDKK